MTIGMAYRFQVLEANSTAFINLNAVFHGCGTRGTPHVKGTHGKLGTWLTD